MAPEKVRKASAFYLTLPSTSLQTFFAASIMF